MLATPSHARRTALAGGRGLSGRDRPPRAMIYDSMSSAGDTTTDRAVDEAARYALAAPLSGAAGELRERPRHRTRHRWVLAVVLAGAVGLVAVLALQVERGPTLASSPLLGKAAPAFDLPRIGDEGTFRPEAGRITVVNFWASWCVPCQRENDVLDQFYEDRPADIELVGVLYGDTRRGALDFRRRYGGRWPLVDDPGGRAALDFGLRGVPETFVIDAEGIVVARLVGGVTRASLESAVAVARDGGTPVTATSDEYRTTPRMSGRRSQR